MASGDIPITVVGNLTGDPELRFTPSGQAVAESLTKGTRVVVTGRLKVRQYDTREGGKGTSVECDVDEVGPALRYATAKVNRVARSDGFGGNQGGGFGGSQAGSGSGGSQAGGFGGRSEDPWASQSGGGFADEQPPPF
jgi:single-strand DNA-binding protein